MAKKECPGGFRLTPATARRLAFGPHYPCGDLGNGHDSCGPASNG